MPTTPDHLIDELPGQLIKGYELRERIGLGGYGAVYRAYQPAVEREVAVKVILPRYANHPVFVRRFETEAQLVARLEHLHIVPLYDYWREPGGAYLIMRYLRGGNLRQALARGAWPVERAACLLEQIAGALALAHRHGVIHRDIKPDNILLDMEGNAYLTDFGIAKEVTRFNRADKKGAPGSLAYIAPEQARNEPVTWQTDVYSLGVVLYEVLTGEHPFPDESPTTKLIRRLTEPVPPLHERRSDLPSSLNEVLQRATAKSASQRYPDILTFANAFREALGSNLSAASDLSASLNVSNPYKGLRAFQEADAADFFGRENLVQQLLSRLSGPDSAFDGQANPHPSSRFLAVVGPSGSGKTSVVKAGLIPALRRGALPASDSWFIVEMMPGAHPLEEVDLALQRIAVNRVPRLLRQLRQDEYGLSKAVRRALPRGAELILIIDQFEEAFTLVEDRAEREHFLNSLVAAILDPHSRLRVVLTLRADYFDRPLLYPAFGDLVRQHTKVVMPLTADELARAIRQPAERVGAVWETELVTAIVADVNAQPGAMPLLQYALTELFERREGRLLTKNAYHAIGGVQGALTRRAQEVYNGLAAGDQEAARRIFLRLATLGEGTDDTHRRVLRSELDTLAGALEDQKAAIQRVIAAFGESRLLSFDRDPNTREPTVELAHEALIVEWPTLRAWLNERRDLLRLHRKLTEAAQEWRRAGRDPELLYRGTRLSQVGELAASGREQDLNTLEREFLSASQALALAEERERQAQQQRELDSVKRVAETAQKLAQAEKQRAEEQARAARQLRERARYLIGALAASLVLIAIALFLGGQAMQNAQRADISVLTAQSALGMADSNALTAQAASTQAVAQQATAQASFQQAESLRLAALSNAVWESGADDELAILLAVQGLESAYMPETHAVLRRVLSRIGLTQQIFTHPTDVMSVALSPDGRFLATGGFDGSVRLWDAAAAKELRTFVGHSSTLSSVAFSADGTRLLTASLDGIPRLWEVETGQEIRRFFGHLAPVNSAVFSPDEQYILTAGADWTARLWSAADGKEIQRFKGHEGAVLWAAFAADGNTIVTGSADTTARLWDVETGKEIRQFIGHGSSVTRVAFTPGGQYVLTGGLDQTARVWVTATGQQLRLLLEGKSLLPVGFSPDGKYLAARSTDGRVFLWDAAADWELRRFIGHTGPISGVAFSADGRYLVTASQDDSARLWEIPTQEIRAFARPGGLSVESIAFSPDGRHLLTGNRSGAVSLWDVETGREEREFSDGVEAWVWSIAFSPDGQYILTGNADETARLWDVLTGNVAREFSGHDGSVTSVAFSPDGRYIFTGSPDGSARLWSAATGRQLRLFSGHANEVNSVAFSPDGRYILTGSADRTALLWDVQSGQVVRPFLGHSSSVLSVGFSPDGVYVITGSADRTARVWEASTGSEVQRFRSGSGVRAVAFSRQGRYLLAASGDVARLWDVDTGLEVRRFMGHLNIITSVAFSPDGKYVATGSGDGTAQLWYTDFDDVIRWLCARPLRDLTTAERADYNIRDNEPTCPQP